MSLPIHFESQCGSARVREVLAHPVIERLDTHSLQFGMHADPNSGPHFLEELNEVEDTHFWCCVKRYLVIALLKRTLPSRVFRLLDLGCGNGSLLASVERAFPGCQTTGIDSCAEALRHARQRTEKAHLLLSDITELNAHLDERYDAVVLSDVLEHLDSPEQTLSQVRSLLQPRGVIIATVPADKRLWSDRDHYLGHRMRYSRAELLELFTRCGFESVCTSHVFSYLFLLAIVHRRFIAPMLRRTGQQVRQTELGYLPVINGLLKWIGFAEVELSFRLPVPFGTSLYCACRKVSDHDPLSLQS